MMPYWRSPHQGDLVKSQKIILSGTDRKDSNTKKISNIIQRCYKEQDEEVPILSLEELGFTSQMDRSYYGERAPAVIQQALDQVLTAEGLILVTPEYNGSVPGVLKWFIDHLKYPEAFEYKPVAFVGLGGMFGGLRPVEHLQQIFGYRNAFIFPERIFLMNVYKNLKDGELTDALALSLLKKQTLGFQKFCRALKGFKDQ